MPIRARTLRILLIAGGVLVALLLGECLIRVFGPPVYQTPTIWIQKEGRWQKVESLTLYMMQLWEQDREGLGAKTPPFEHIRGWYDRPQWDYFDAEGFIDYRTNRFGFRDHDFEQTKPSDEYRILAIGDSFTFGLGVRTEDCWTEVLETLLEEKRNRSCEVINGAYAAGNQIAHYPEWVAENGFRFEPDLLLIVICLNDLDPDIPLLLTDTGYFVPWLKGRSRLLYMIQKQWIRWKRGPIPMRDFSESMKDHLTTWEGEKEAIRAIHEDAGRAGVDVKVVVMPMLTRLVEVYPFTGLHEMIRDFCNSEGIEVIDLLETFLGHYDTDLWVHPTDQHPNRIGHRIIGEALCRRLTAQK